MGGRPLAATMERLLRVCCLLSVLVLAAAAELDRSDGSYKHFTFTFLSSFASVYS